MGGPALAIRSFALAIEAPAARAPDLARRARQAVRERLPAALGERLSAAPQGPLLMIRRIDLDLTVLEGDDAQRIADRLAEAIAVAVARASAPTAAAPDSAEGDAMPRFAGRAALAAAFLTALGEGRGFDAWWFRGFDGVRLLAPSAAVRTVLLREPSEICAVFAALDPAIRGRLAVLLSEADAELLLDALATLPVIRAPGADWAALAAALRQANACTPLARAVEALMILAARPLADIGGETAAAARAGSFYLAASRPKAQASPRKRRAGPAAMAERRRAPLPEALRAAMISDKSDGSQSRADAPLFSPLGGYALLLQSLLELDLAGLAERWPDIAGVGPERGLQLLILAAAAGDRRLLEDPFWRRLLALPPRLAVADLADWLDSAPPMAPLGPLPVATHRRVALPPGLGPPRARKAIAALARRTLVRFAGRLPGFASASAPFLRMNLLDAGATLSGEEGMLRIRLERPLLDVLLSITGAGERELAFPDGRLVRLERRE